MNIKKNIQANTRENGQGVEFEANLDVEFGLNLDGDVVIKDVDFDSMEIVSASHGSLDIAVEYIPATVLTEIRGAIEFYLADEVEIPTREEILTWMGEEKYHEFVWAYGEILVIRDD